MYIVLLSLLLDLATKVQLADSTVTPETVGNVCPMDVVNLTCSVSADNLLWSLPREDGTFFLATVLASDTNDIGQRSIPISPSPYVLILDSVTPMLTSTLEVTVVEYLDGRAIPCSDSSAVINFHDLPSAPLNLRISEIVNNSDSSSVTVQWDPPQSNEPLVDNYTVSVTPTPVSGEDTSVVTQTQIEFVLDYNQPYTVQVVATNCIGTNNTAAKITFTLVKCDDPPVPINGQALGMDRAEGSTVTLICNDGYTPVGDTSSTCTSDMTWVPDPVLFECRPVSCSLPLEPTNGAILDYKSFNQTVEEGTMLTYQCDSGLSLTGPMIIRCTNDGEWSDDPEGNMCGSITQGTPVPLSTGAVAGITFAVTAVVFTIFGFLAGLLVMYLITHKKRVYSPTEGQANVQPTVPAGPVYEDVVPVPKQEIELKTNDAYGQVRN